MNKHKIPIILVIIFLPCFIQAQDVKDLITRYFNDLRIEKHSTLPLQLALPENAKKALTTVTPYTYDTIVSVRSKSYDIIRFVASKSQLPAIRQQAAMQLIIACRDKDSGNVGSVLEYLTEFKKEDYTPIAKDSLRALYRSKVPHVNRLIKLIGFVALSDLQQDLKILSQQTAISKRDRWAAQLALARMGDQEMMASIMNRVKKIEVSDDVIYEIFPDLVYTRQPQAISYMVEVLNSDAKNCTSADAENETHIPCGYRVMEQLATIIEGYPLKLDASGDIDTKDYVAALTTVRTWFKQHADYKILNDKY